MIYGNLKRRKIRKKKLMMLIITPEKLNFLDLSQISLRIFI